MYLRLEDKLIKRMPIKECGERLVKLRSGRNGIFVDMEEMSRKAQGLPLGQCYVRKAVAVKLIKAQSYLPKGMHLKIIDGFRPISAQKRIYLYYFRKFKREKKMSKDALEAITDDWVSNPWKGVPPHSTGGTVDLTILDKEGMELDMGSLVNSTEDVSATNSRNISKEGRRNRRLLINIMTKSGFVNYMQEWWHWSYGDRRWAVAKRKGAAIYGPL
jgi:zinc D-Ala-D-Ala dipeptidase